MSARLTFLATPEAVRADWHKCLPFVQRCVDEAVLGEYLAEDVFERALSGVVLPFYATDGGGNVVLAGALEQVFYPRFKTVHVLCVAGRNLQDVAEDCFEEIKRFASSIGAAHIEASASPAMARILRRIGFRFSYQCVRLPLVVKNESAQVPEAVAV